MKVAITRFVESLSKNPHRLLRRLLYALVAGALLFYAYNFEIYGESPEQNLRARRLGAVLKEQHKAVPSSVPERYSWLPYAQACRRAEPRIAQENCLHLAVEGPTMEIARQEVTRMSQAVRTAVAKQPNLKLSGVYLVLQPVVRDKTYVGEITEYSIGKFFETGDQMISKIGE